MIFEKWIVKTAETLKSYFYFDDWSLEFSWRELDEDHDNATTVFSISSDDSYQLIYLNIFPFAKVLWIEKDYNKLITGLVHEFCHVLTDPLYKFGINAASNQTGPFLENIRERWTQKIALVVLRSLPKKLWFPN